METIEQEFVSITKYIDRKTNWLRDTLLLIWNTNLLFYEHGRFGNRRGRAPQRNMNFGR